MSNRVRSFLFALTVCLATATPVVAASAHGRESRREHARAEHGQAIGRRDVAIGVWNVHGRGFGSASARWSRVFSGRSSFSASSGPFGFGSSLVGSAPVGASPSTLAVDPATHTIYVANGYNDNGPQLPVPGNTVSVIDTRHCQAQDISHCKGPWPTITVGNLPSGIAIDRRTDTVYVSNVGDNTVSVFNGATCNAENTKACTQTPATVPVGPDPLGIFADPANHTVYVPDYGDAAVGGAFDGTTVSMLDSATCNATALAECPTSAPPTVDVGASPDDVSVDQANHTVYVTTVSNGNPGSNSGWTVFDANTCNATVQSGCDQLGILPGDPMGPNAAEIDLANNTLYSANYDTTISAFDLADCNAGDLSGCATDAPGTVTAWPDPGFGEHDLSLAVDQSLHSVYVSFQVDAALVVVDTSVCNAAHLAACATLDPSTIHTGADPEAVVLDRSTQTLYTANVIDNDISVIDASKCNADNTSGCRHPAPTTPIFGPGALATDSAVHTAYITSGTDSVALLNTQTCNAYHLAACAQAPPQFTAGQNGTGVAVDDATHTVYVANAGAGSSGTVSVIDDSTCNATDQADCGDQQTLQVPAGNPVAIAVNPLTDTIYVATNTASGPNLISVFNGATCNASHFNGCAQTPAALTVGTSGGPGIDLAINDVTNTLYVTNNLYADPTGDAVYVFNAATCDAQNMTGCDQTPPTVTVGDDPAGLAVDPSTDTIYVVVHAEGDYAASVAVINGATCNGQTTFGCDQTPTTVAAGWGALAADIDTTTGKVYTTNLQDASVSVLGGHTCNARDTSGCGHTSEDAVGNYPFAIAVDPAAGTAYVANLANVSVIPLTR